MKDERAASLADAFERALGAILARVCISEPAAIAVAYSGGLDSTALLHLAHAWAAHRQTRLFAFHVHHGLSPQADHWLAHCERTAAGLGMTFDARRISIPGRPVQGIEQAARQQRYAALGTMCRAHGVPLLLTAHHQDDQAETVLLQLLRGAGVAGLAGMQEWNAAPGLLGGGEPVMGRPLLQSTRADLDAFVRSGGLDYVDDESNLDTRYMRNALRQHVMPALRAHFPGFEERLVRTAGHAQAAHALLNELAEQDLARCADGDGILVDRLRSLSPERRNNVLRRWFALNDVRMPSTARLEQMCSQVLQARADARLLVTHGDWELHRHRNRIFVAARRSLQASEPVLFRWRGEDRLHFASYGGCLRFTAAGQGFDAAWLQTQDLVLCRRSGGERLRSAPNRPTRSMKQHFQTLGVPEWQRMQLPLLFAGKQLLFAAGIGLNWNAPVSEGADKVALSWESDGAAEIGKATDSHGAFRP